MQQHFFSIFKFYSAKINFSIGVYIFAFVICTTFIFSNYLLFKFVISYKYYFIFTDFYITRMIYLNFSCELYLSLSCIKIYFVKIYNSRIDLSSIEWIQAILLFIIDLTFWNHRHQAHSIFALGFMGSLSQDLGVSTFLSCLKPNRNLKGQFSRSSQFSSSLQHSIQLKI